MECGPLLGCGVLGVARTMGWLSILEVGPRGSRVPCGACPGFLPLVPAPGLWHSPRAAGGAFGAWP
eukprot:9312268-Alexandrium_andersonii.AAC.1